MIFHFYLIQSKNIFVSSFNVLGFNKKGLLYPLGTVAIQTGGMLHDSATKNKNASNSIFSVLAIDR